MSFKQKITNYTLHVRDKAYAEFGEETIKQALTRFDAMPKSVQRVADDMARCMGYAGYLKGKAVGRLQGVVFTTIVFIVSQIVVTYF